MHDFLIKELQNIDIEKELIEIGFDKSYTHKAKDKFEYKNLKIYNLTVAQANILKQTALSVGADCATHKDVITGKIDISNSILGGSFSQLKKIAQKLKLQPFGLKTLAEKIELTLTPYLTPKTQIIGILNLTQNSFSDGGKYYDFDNAISHLKKLINDGADIIDIGAESTKPGAKEISPQEQLTKLIPILEYINKNYENRNFLISIDTRHSEVAQKTIELGADIINDVSGLNFDCKMISLLAKHPKIKIIIQHSKGEPENMQIAPNYENLIDEIFINLKEKCDLATQNGILKENIIIDPGIGFGKTREHNFEILNHWKELKAIGCPILIGLSRKSLLNIQNASNEEKDIYTLALNSRLIEQNIDYIRVHNVKIHKNLLEILN